MIQSTTGVQPGFFLNIIRVRSRQGRITVPVHPAHSVYARFKHIQGVPSPEGGVPMFKLRILDNLIDRLLQYKQKVPDAAQLASLRLKHIDPLIGDLERRLQSRLLSFKPSFGGFFPETGMLVDLVA